VRRYEVHRSALLFACLWLLAQLASGAHLALVPHAVCAEHGELVEVNASASDGAPEAPDSGPRSDPGSESPSEGVDGHDHCFLAASREQRPLPASSAPCISPGDAGVVDERANDATTLPSFALYLLAPKHSPPTAPLALRG